MGVVEQYLLQLNTEKRRWHRAVSILTVLSFVVALITTWNLRMTGVTIANSASCGLEEHRHTEECVQQRGELICGKEEGKTSAATVAEEANAETPAESEAPFPRWQVTTLVPLLPPSISTALPLTYLCEVPWKP